LTTGRARAAGLAAGLLALAACGSSASPVPSGSPNGASAGPTNAVSSAVASTAGGPAPTCPPIPPVAPPPELGQPGWWLGRTFYEVFVRSFADSNGDGIGDLDGLLAKLDDLNDGNPATTTDLGVTALWLMPTFPSPSYHGYDVTDYRGVNPDFGSPADLRKVVEAAHARGMAVILDLPLNHTSDQNPWFVASAKGTGSKRDWYVWSDQPEGNNWQAFGNRYYYAAFGPDLPDLNLRNPDVTAEVTMDAEHWLDDVGVDGFRLDAAKYLIEDGPTTENTPETHEWWKTFRGAVEGQAPGALLLGEVWDLPQVSASYVPDDLDLTFDFALDTGYLTAAQTGDASGLGRLETRLLSTYATGTFGAFLSNHDMDRVASQLHGDAGQMRVAADLLLTGPGVPFVYYGEEIGMSGAKPDERIRTPMRWDASSPAAGFSTHAPWEPLSDDPASVNVADERADPGSLWSRYRDLIALRAAHPALATGTSLAVTSDAPAVLARLRVAPTETALVLTNTGTTAAAPTLTLNAGPLCGAPAATAVLGADGVTAPTITATGGFGGYRPVAAIPAQSSVVITLASR
jgi:glycosidase